MWRFSERVEEVKTRLNDVVIMREIALTVAFTAMVFLSTSLFYLALVSSTGFFNLGEVFVYLAALIGGPFVGMVAGGLGAAMADMALGYGIYAPATLVLKGSEGFSAGMLYRFTQRVDQRVRLIFLAIITVFLVGFSVYVTTPLLNGVSDSSNIGGAFVIYGFDLEAGIITQEFPFEFPGFFLVGIAVILCIILWYVGLFMGEKGQMALSCVLSGSIIIIGYFLYQLLFILEPPLSAAFPAALSEVPFNVAQVIFGTVIAIPIVSYLRELGVIPEPSPASEVENGHKIQE